MEEISESFPPFARNTIRNPAWLPDRSFVPVSTFLPLAPLGLDLGFLWRLQKFVDLPVLSTCL